MGWRDDFRHVRRMRRLQRLATLTLLTIVIVGVNLLFWRWPVRVGGKDRLQPHAECISVAQSLPQPVSIAIVYDDADGFAEAGSLRQSLQIFLENTKTSLFSAGVAFEYDFFHRVKHAGSLRRWLDGSSTHSPIGCGIFVRAGNRLRELSLSSCYILMEGKVRGFSFDSALLEAFQALAKPHPPTIAFTVGHGERSLHRWRMEDGLGCLVQWIGRQGWDVQTVDGSTISQMDAANSLLVIVDPRAPFSPAEEISLQHFLGERNGRLLLILTPDSRAGLADLLSQWHVHVEGFGETVSEFDENIQVQHFSNDLPFLTPLLHYQLPVQFESILVVGEESGDGGDWRIKVHPLLGFNRPSGGSPVPVGVIAQYPEADAPIIFSNGRLAVIGGNFLSNRNFSLLGNQLFFQQLTKYLLEVEMPPSPQLPDEFRLGLTRTQMWHIGRVLICGPTLLFLVACFLWWLRR
jgi:hypothetical protein